MWCHHQREQMTPYYWTLTILVMSIRNNEERATLTVMWCHQQREQMTPYYWTLTILLMSIRNNEERGTLTAMWCHQQREQMTPYYWTLTILVMSIRNNEERGTLSSNIRSSPVKIISPYIICEEHLFDWVRLKQMLCLPVYVAFH